jgi:hypothetical protein
MVSPPETVRSAPPPRLANDAARAALADYQRLAGEPIETYARSVWPLPGHLALFLDGIALAEGKSQAEAPADG